MAICCSRFMVIPGDDISRVQCTWRICIANEYTKRAMTKIDGTIKNHNSDGSIEGDNGQDGFMLGSWSASLCL